MLEDNFIGRLKRWYEQIMLDIRKRWWWLLAGPISGFVWALFMDRIIGGTNRYIDAHLSLIVIKPAVATLWSSPAIHPIAIAVIGFIAVLLVMIALAYLETRPAETNKKLTSDEPSLLGRTRQLIVQLRSFVDENCDPHGKPNVYKINFGYAAHYRLKVEQIFNELAAEEILEICEDWVINPQTQTAKNIRENIIARLARLADRLEARTSEKAPPKTELSDAWEADGDGGPRILLNWDYPPEAAYGGLRITHKILTVENSSKTEDAFNVTFEEINLVGALQTQISASIKPIHRIPAGHQVQADIVLKGNVPDGHKGELEMVYFAAGDVRKEFKVTDEEGERLRFPIVVMFKDYSGTEYQALFEFTDNLESWSPKQYISFIRRERLKITRPS